MEPYRLQGWVHSIVGGNCHKHNFCRNKRVFCHDKRVLSRQNYFRRDERVCCDKTRLSVVATYLLLRQLKHCKYFCRDKTGTCFVASILLSWQKHVFVATNACLLLRKWYLWQFPPTILTQPFSRWLHSLCVTTWSRSVWPHVFVATKLVTWQAYFCHFKRLTSPVLSREK